MANTYTQIYIQVVFAVSGRRCLISRRWEEELHKYIAGSLRNENQKLIAINAKNNEMKNVVGHHWRNRHAHTCIGE